MRTSGKILATPLDDKWDCDLDKVKIRGEVVSSLMLGKRIFRVPPTGVEPMTPG